jgi:hypothetical protein
MRTYALNQEKEELYVHKMLKKKDEEEKLLRRWERLFAERNYFGRLPIQIRLKVLKWNKNRQTYA